jgi:hypothetical protein
MLAFAASSSSARRRRRRPHHRWSEKAWLHVCKQKRCSETEVKRSGVPREKKNEAR